MVGLPAEQVIEAAKPIRPDGRSCCGETRRSVGISAGHEQAVGRRVRMRASRVDNVGHREMLPHALERGAPGSGHAVTWRGDLVRRGLAAVARMLAVSLLGLLAYQPAAFGRTPNDDHEAVARLAIVVLVIVVALLSGLLLYWLSQRSTQARVEKGGGSESGQAEVASQNSTSYLPRILEALDGVAPQQRQQVARSVSQLFSKALDSEVRTATQKLDQRYGKVIEEQRRSSEILQRKYQGALSDRKQTVAVLESVAEGLVVVDNQGKVVMLNPAAERLLGVTQLDRVGKPLTEDLKAGQLVSLAKDVEGKQQEIVVSAKEEATKRILRSSNAMVADENGNTVGMVAVLSDVTKQRELDELKSEFVSKVGHELRSPIMAILHSLAILADGLAGPLSEEQREFVDLSQRNLKQLSELINDLLDLSKLEAKKMELKREPAAIATVIQSVCHTLDAWARSKAITLSQRVPADLPQVPMDQAKVGQVLTNLIGNAIKFTPEQGRITVEAKRVTDGAIEVGVSDTGVGIAKEDLPKLFNKFQQVGERTATDMAGTGLGLAISKEIVDLHGGRIWAESESKQGARFCFTLPLTPLG